MSTLASPSRSTIPPLPPIGLIGFGAFGRLMAHHLGRHARLVVHDRALAPGTTVDGDNVSTATLAEAARCPIVVLATPLDGLGDVLLAIGPHLPPGALVLDVCSVKVEPARMMAEILPDHVDIVATHPLFGPQSAADGLAGKKIAVCPVRGTRTEEVVAFLQTTLSLDVVMTTPGEHDREMAMVQGLTHLVAKVLVAMEPVPTRMTTRSFDLLVQATNLVRHDAPEVFDAITRANPYVRDLRARLAAMALA